MSRRALLTLLLASLAACGGGDGGDAPGVGESSFRSRPPGGAFGPMEDADRMSGGAPAAPAADSGDDRDVAEGDLYAWASPGGATLLVLNGTRGLAAVDLADPARPRLLSRVPLTGRPVELYVRGGVALLTVTDWWGWSLAADGAPRATTGSQLWAVDVRDPAAPRVLSRLEIEGTVEASRAVGEVLYLVTRPSSWGGLPVGGGVVTASAPVEARSGLAVESLDLSDPAAPRRVARVEATLEGWAGEAHVHVTSSRILAGVPSWTDAGEVTRFLSFDVSDPAGAILRGGEWSAPGRLVDRWSLDLDEASGVARAVLHDGWNEGATVRTWDARDAAAAPAPLGALAIDVAETLTAARFDGRRAYVVTAVRSDPLWAVDLADPARPVLTGHLEMPGQLDHLEPRGDRLVALGHTDEADGPWQLHVSLFDVAAPAPRLLSRVFVGGEHGWVAASRDDLRKAFQVLEGEGLVLVPYQSWDRGSWTAEGGTQLVSWEGDALAKRGLVAGAGAVLRAFPLPGRPGLLAAFSEERLQTIDAADRAAPRELAALDLARPAWDLARAGDQLAVLGGGASHASELVVVPADDPDAATPAARIALGAPATRVFARGEVAWVLQQDWRDGRAWLRAFDLSEPARPVARGALELRDAAQGWGWVTVALAPDRPLAAALVSSWAARGDVGTEVLLLDLADPAAPSVLWRAPVAGTPVGDLLWSGGLLWFSRYERDAEPGWVRFQLERVDATRPSSPVRAPPVNVPGALLAASADGRRIHTVEAAWDGEGPGRTRVHALALAGGVARLERTLELEGSPSGAVAAAGAAFVTSTRWEAGRAEASLVGVDLAAMRGGEPLPLEAGWPYPVGLAGRRLLVATSWPAPAVLVLDVADPLRPALLRSTPGHATGAGLATDGATAWLPAGPYGVTAVPLAR